ncbi:hypothetical protein P9112_003692 [Eukaryota sp. TZLM1-RC]
MSETRNLKIQTSVLRRIVRELDYYRAEVTQQESKIDSMRQTGSDDADINKQMEVLDESRQMIPDTLHRLESAWHNLNQCLDEFIDENPHFEGEEIDLARHQLKAAEDHLTPSSIV